MSIPKYKEHHEDRCERLGIDGIHIYWCPEGGSWEFSVGCPIAGPSDYQKAAAKFCEEQDARWTPRSKQ